MRNPTSGIENQLMHYVRKFTFEV